MCLALDEPHQRKVARFYHEFTRQVMWSNGSFKKKCQQNCSSIFGGLYCCFIQTWCINNDWKYDFWYLWCLFYQVESILFHFQQLQIFVFQKFSWNTAKMVKNLQCLFACLYLCLILIGKWLRTSIRTSETEIAEKMRTSSLGKKLGVLLKKKCIWEMMWMIEKRQRSSSPLRNSFNHFSFHRSQLHLIPPVYCHT